MIELEHVTKRYGDKIAVDDLSLTVPPGRVTGFLGPNGAGKSTTMRLVLGLDAPTKGRVTVNGTRYRDHRFPLHEVGALLEARAVHPGRTARSHLRWLAASNGLPGRRADEVLEQVGLADVARKRSGGFSLGMGQRLGIAAALLGDPGILLLDEPVNGLDPEGVLWIRHLLRDLAAQGRTVLVSSHLMSEVALTADHLIVIGRGRLLADASVQEVISRGTTNQVRVVSPDLGRMAEALREAGGTVETDSPDSALVGGIDAPQIGEIAARLQVTLHELSPLQASLEDVFMEMTRDSGEYTADPAMAGPR